jgi:hypothetical protein
LGTPQAGAVKMTRRALRGGFRAFAVAFALMVAAPPARPKSGHYPATFNTHFCYQNQLFNNNIDIKWLTITH